MLFLSGVVSCFFFLRQGDDLTAATIRASLPLPTAFVPEAPRKITEEEREFQAYRTLRNERATARHEGKRKVREAKVSNCFIYVSNCLLKRCNLCRRPRRRPTRRSNLFDACFLFPCTTLAPCYYLHHPCTQNLARPGFYSIICHMHEYDRIFGWAFHPKLWSERRQLIAM